MQLQERRLFAAEALNSVSFKHLNKVQRGSIMARSWQTTCLTFESNFATDCSSCRHQHKAVAATAKQGMQGEH
jgi:hypothetical protein